jgi:hypothetical protein
MTRSRRGYAPYPLTLTEAGASVKNSRIDCCAIANGQVGRKLGRKSAHTLLWSARMPIRVRKMGPAIPLTALLAILLSAMVAGFIHPRNRLAELFLGFYGCCVHRILHGTKGGAAGKGRFSGRVRPRQFCPRRYTQYTPGRRKLPPYFSPCRRRKEYSRAQISLSLDRIG